MANLIKVVLDKIILNKITFKNGASPAINAQNLEAMQQNAEDAINTLNENVETELNTIIENVQDLQEKETVNNTTAEQNRRFIESMLKDMQTEGTSIHVEDSADFGCKLVPFGKSEQKTRSGKNKFKYEAQPYLSANCTKMGDITNGYWYKGTTTESTSEGTYGKGWLTLPTVLEANKGFKLSFDIQQITAGFINNISLGVYRADNSNAGSIANSNITISSTKQRISITLVARSHNWRVRFQLNSNEVKITNIMITDADEENQDYEEYGISPSPEYPSSIENVEGNLELKVTGKNLFNVNDTDISTFNAAGKIINDNSITVTSDEATALARIEFNMDYPINKPLALSFDATILEGSDLANPIRVYFRKGSSTICGGDLTITNNKKSYNFTTNGIPSKDYKLWLYVKSAAVAGTVKVKFDNIQVEEGTIATAYELYKEPQTVTFPLSEGQKLMEGSYLADDGIHHTRRHFELAIANMNNSEEYPGWANLPNLHDDFPEKNAKFNNVTDYYSNIYKSQEQKININTVATRSSLFFNPDCGLTQTQWKEQYPDLVFKIEYGLPEGKEWTEPYTEVQAAAKKEIDALKTHQTVTNITNSQNTKMKLTYKKDIQTQIAEIVANNTATTNLDNTETEVE